MFPSGKSIVISILSVLILSMQITYTIQSGGVIASKLLQFVSKGASAIPSLGAGSLLTICLGVFSNLVFNSMDVAKPDFNHAAAFNDLQTHIDTQFDGVRSLINSESQRIISSVLTHFDQQNIRDEGFKKLDELRRDNTQRFLKCVSGRLCANDTRQKYIDDYIQNGYEKLSVILRNYIFRHEAQDRSKRIFEVILDSFEHEDQYAKNYPCVPVNHKRQEYIYYNYMYISSVTQQHYVKILFSLKEMYMIYKSANSTDSINTKAHMEDTFNNMKKDLKLITEAAVSALKKTPRGSTRLCDPKKHEKGITYEKLDYFIQAYVVPEKHLIPGPTIGGDKTYYDSGCDPRFMLPSWAWKESRYQCHTYRQLVNCEYLAHSVTYIGWKSAGYGLKFFRTQNEFHSGDKFYGKWSDDLRHDGLPQHVYRYVYHQSERPYILELDAENSKYQDMQPFSICQLDSLNPNFSGIDNIYPEIDWEVGRALASVNEDSREFYYNTIRKFSELPVQVSSGKFLTGVRFRVLNRIIYMQIQQGNYINNSIDPASLEWKKIIENQEKVQTLNIHRRSFNLDDIEVPLGSFVTGVQFVFNQNTVSLGVYGTEVDLNRTVPYNETEYKMQTKFYPPPSNLDQRQEIKLVKPGPSDWAINDTRHEIKSRPGIDFVRFQLTDPIKDLHTTVPYLDIRDVVEINPRPLGGIGIEYRGKEGFGGFIGFKLISTDIISLLNVYELENTFDEVVKKIKNQLNITVS